MTNERQQKILELVQSCEIETQSELAKRLAATGIQATQATLSRDIRKLGLTKEPAGGGHQHYVLPKVIAVDAQTRLRTIFRESVVSVTRAQNLVIIKTLPGLAPAACAAIDKMEIQGLAGSIAGDDTAFLALVDDDCAEVLCRTMKKAL